MEEVIQYLEQKNLYYQKFFDITVKFLEKARGGQWDDVMLFMDNRERILNIIRSYDFRISAAMNQVSESQDVSAFKSTVRALLAERKRIADKIVTQDLELSSLIDELKTETVRELKTLLDTHYQVSSFTPPPATNKKPLKSA